MQRLCCYTYTASAVWMFVLLPVELLDVQRQRKTDAGWIAGSTGEQCQPAAC